MRSSSSAACRDGLRDAARPRVDLAVVLRADRLTREIPLVEQEERLPPAPAAARSSCDTLAAASSVEVE